MRRRKFLKNAGLGTLVLGSASVLPTNLWAGNAPKDPKFVYEKELKIPVICEADVVVCGGGPSGIGAAIEAARRGAKTVLIESAGFLGGTWTAGLLGVILDTKDKDDLLKELMDKLTERN